VPTENRLFYTGLLEMTNPYTPPQATTASEYASDFTRRELKRIAALHRLVVACIWAYVVILASGLLLDFRIVNEAWASGWVGVAAVVIGLVAVVPVFLLVKQLRGGWRWILLCPVAPVPLVGFFALLSVNRVVNRALREGGVKVGWFGAQRSIVPGNEER
jgi:hypothetical protein